MNISYQPVNGTQVAIITDIENASFTAAEWQGFADMICQRFEQMLPTVAIVSVTYDVLKRIIENRSGNGYLAHKIVGRLWEMGVKKIDYLPVTAQPQIIEKPIKRAVEKPVEKSAEKPIKARDYCINGGRGGTCKPICQIDGDGKVIREFPSIAAAAAYYGLNKTSLAQCCRGQYKTCGGRLWRYKEAQ